MNSLKSYLQDYVEIQSDKLFFMLMQIVIMLPYADIDK